MIDGLVSNYRLVADALTRGSIVFLRTDTIYGLLTVASDEASVSRLQKIRQRDPGKAFIVLAASADQAFGSDAQKLKQAYDLIDSDQPTSVVIDNSDAPKHLLHSDGSIAYRIPKPQVLHELLLETGPVVAPSANPAGKKPAGNVDEARSYFGDLVEVYVDDGQIPIDQQPSRVVRLDETGKIDYLR